MNNIVDYTIDLILKLNKLFDPLSLSLHPPLLVDSIESSQSFSYCVLVSTLHSLHKK